MISFHVTIEQHCENNEQIIRLAEELGYSFRVEESKMDTRMGMPTVKDAPGIEIVQTYNLMTHDQIVGMVMNKLM